MSSVVHPAEFFVVGGPVDPERSCYVLRGADAALASAIRGRRFCCVLGPPAVGKTSLLLRAAAALRESGARVAYVPLGAAGAAAGLEPPAIATRVAAALELDVDVEAWWRAAEPRVGEPRLVEFFAEVVLARLPQPVFVLFDDAEALLDRPGRVELLDAIIACHARREREPGFARLGFVLAGRTSLRPLLGGAERDAASTGVAVVEPADFSATEAYRLAAAFGGEPAHAQALMDRICAWTGGHPYLTQKVARGVARKGGRLEDVERIVRAELLAAEAAEVDLALAPMRARLSAATRPARRAAKLVGRLGTGARVAVPADAAVREELRLAGAVLPDDGRLRARNRVVKELAAAGWLKPKRSRVKFAALAATCLLALSGGGYWYARYLPAADIATLTDTTAAPSAVEQAYRRLRALPGFVEQADALWLESLTRQSRAATALAEATAVDAQLRALPGQEGVADRLLGEFWLRRARTARFGEQREAALLFAQRAARMPGAAAAASAELAELVGEDYALLERSLRLPAAPASWQMAWGESLLLSFDAERRLVRVPIDTAAEGGSPGIAPLPLTALAHAPLVRELSVEGEGAAGDFELSVTVAHPATGELFVTLAAPSGATGTVTLPHIAGETSETFVFEAVRGTALAELANEVRAGAWRLTLVDRSGGNAGALVNWGLTFSETGPRDEPLAPVAIPDPARVEAVTLAIEGPRALAWAAAPGPLGSVALWNLATGVLEHDLALPAVPKHVALNAAGTRVLAETERVLTLFDTASGAVVARVGTQTEFVLPPVFSAEGAYVAIAERVDGARPLYSVLRSADGSLVASFVGPSDVTRWEVGLGARYAAFLGPANVVRVVTPRGGIEFEPLVHATEVARLVHLPDGVLVTVDAEGLLEAWSLGGERASVQWRGRAVSPASISVAAGAPRLAYTRPDGAVAVVDARNGAELARLRQPRVTPPTLPQLTPDGARLITQSGTLLRFWTVPAGVGQPGAAAVTRTVVALDRDGEFAVAGLASGQVEFGAAIGRTEALAFFGHRGAVTAAAVLGSFGVAVTGGADGVVRLWDTASGAPTGVVAQPASEPISAVALGPDGRYVASAAGRNVRVASVADGVVSAEHAAAAQVTALALASDALAFADASGSLVLAPLGVAARVRSPLTLDSAVSALAFAPDARRLAVGTASGVLKVIGSADGAELAALRLPAAIRWIDFAADGRTLLVATEAWLHAFTLEPDFLPLASRLVRLPPGPVALAPASGTAVRIGALDGAGMLELGSLDVAAVPTAPAGADVVGRDWSAALRLRLDDAGLPVPLDP